MDLVLNTWERMTLAKMLGEIKGNLSLLRKAGTVLDILELSEEEKDAVGFQVVVSPDGGLGYQWQDTQRTFEVAIHDHEAEALLTRTFERYENWSVSEYVNVERLAEKLGLAPDSASDNG